MPGREVCTSLTERLELHRTDACWLPCLFLMVCFLTDFVVAAHCCSRHSLDKYGLVFKRSKGTLAFPV